ncbi:MAG: glucose-6-phosphate dehydrogenase [Polyangiales bacterium]
MSEHVSVHADLRPSIVPNAAGPTLLGDPCTLVILGGAGDLAKRKLIPAYYDLARKNLLGPGWALVGVGTESFDDEKFRALAHDSIASSDEVTEFDEGIWRELRERLFFVSGDLTKRDVFTRLHERLGQIEAMFGRGARETQNRLFYLAVPPSIFTPIVEHLSKSELVPRKERASDRPWTRVILEKPFGRSLETARTLNALVLDAFAEHQIYRIDHYLGKETVQNILVLRSANAIFESMWSRDLIASVQITAAETVGVEQRAGYYEHAGVVRDMFQNHLLQLLALTAMEPPEGTDADAIRDEKVKVLKHVVPLGDSLFEATVLGQYGPGAIKGAAVPGYRSEPGVSATSRAPTYAAMKLMVDTPRWRGVPFYLRSGKRMHKRITEIAIQLRQPRRLMFEKCANETIEPNELVLRVQPDDGVSLRFEVKVPGAALALTPGIEVLPVDMTFDYDKAFGSESHPAYETLLLDCMIGDATLFTRSDEVDAGWSVTEPILNAWEGDGAPAIVTYAAGSWGPEAADALLARDGFRWRKP